MDNINENAEYLSASGFTRLKSELVVLKDKKRKEIAERLEYAKSLGDLSENAEYQEAKEEQQLIESRIADLEDILSRAVLISQPASLRKKGTEAKILILLSAGKKLTRLKIGFQTSLH